MRKMPISIICVVMVAVFHLMALTENASGDTKKFETHVPDELLVKFRTDIEFPMANDFIATKKTKILKKISNIKLYRLKNISEKILRDVMDEFRKDERVEYAELNYYDYPVETSTSIEPNDTYYNRQWHYPLINLPDAWAISSGNNITVAVVDTGIRPHPDLASRILPNGWDFMDNDNDPTAVSSNHGIHVAGTIGAVTNNGSGVAGVSWGSTILPIRAVGTHFDLAQGFRYACGLLESPDPVNPTPVPVINYSGGGSHSQTKEQAVAACNEAGVIMVCAAGNDMCGSVIHPAAYSTTYDRVIAVGATDYNFGGLPQRPYYSSCGPELNVVAPGGGSSDSDGDGYIDGIYSTSWDMINNLATYEYKQGTSMASPHVAGIVALMLARGHSASQIRSILEETATDLGPEGFDNEYGHGLVNALDAVNYPLPEPEILPDVNIIHIINYLLLFEDE